MNDAIRLPQELDIISEGRVSKHVMHTTASLEVLRN